MKFTIKLIRTVIGLPVVVLVYPICIIAIPLGVCGKAVFDGEITEVDKIDLIMALTLPYQFIKKVWCK